MYNVYIYILIFMIMIIRSHLYRSLCNTDCFKAASL